MRNERLRDYYFITTGTPLLESGIHMLQTGKDFSLMPSKELVVKMGQPKGQIKLGFCAKTERHKVNLNLAYNLLKYMENNDVTTLEEMNKFFEPSGFSVQGKVPNIENLRNISQLEFNKLFMAGTGRQRNNVLKLYNTTMTYIEFLIQSIGGEVPKRKTHFVENIEISIDTSDEQIGNLQQQLLGEFLDESNLIKLLEYAEIHLTAQPKTDIQTYALYRGGNGDKRLAELIRFSNANISINSKGTIMSERGLHSQLPMIYFEGEREKDTHVVVDDTNVPNPEMIKAFLWYKKADKEEILFNALSQAPLLDDIPEVSQQEQNVEEVEGDEIDIEFMYDDQRTIGLSEDIHTSSTPYRDLFKDVRFLSGAEIYRNAISNGCTQVYDINPTQVRTVKELLQLDHRVLGLKEVRVKEEVIGSGAAELLKVFNLVVSNVKRVDNQLNDMIRDINAKMQAKMDTTVEDIIRKKESSIERMVGKIGEGLNLPLICSDKNYGQVHDEFLSLTDPGCNDGLVLNSIRENQISTLDVWGENEELVDGITIPEPLLQHLVKGTKQLVESLLRMTLSANRNEFINAYMNLEDNDDEEVMISKLTEAYKSVF